MSSSKIKIIFRNRSMEAGGTESVLINIFSMFDYEKYEVVLLLNYRQGEFLNRIPKNVRLVTIGEGSQIFSQNKIINVFQKIKRRVKYWIFEKYPRAFYKEHGLLNFDYEVAFSHFMLKDVLNSPNKKSKKIYWIHGDLRNTGFSERNNQRMIAMMQSFDKGVFVSKHGKKIAEKHWNVKLNNAEVIYNPFSIHRILDQSKETVEEKFHNVNFIGVGRLFWQKGFKDLIHAHKQLINQGYQIKTLVLGDGMQREELEKLILDFRIGDSFFLYGYAENPVKFIQNAEFLVLPSYSESYPMVIGEALCLNKPVLATKVGGVEEMIQHNENGLLFNPGKEGLYETMKKVLDDRTLRLKLSTAYSTNNLYIRNKVIKKAINILFR